MIRPPKRKNSSGTDNRSWKYQALSTKGSPSPSASASDFDDSLALANPQLLSGSSSSLPTAYGTTSIGSSSSLTMRPRTSARSISRAPNSSLNRIVSAPMMRQISLNDQFSRQTAITNVESTFPASDASYDQTSHASRLPMEHDHLRGPNGPVNLRAQGDAMQHFKLDIVAPDLENDSAATIPPGWSSRQGIMAYPTLFQDQYSSIPSGHDSITSDRCHAASSCSPANATDYRPALCYLCNEPQDDGAIVGLTYETSDDFVVHLWEAHMGASEWLEKECPLAVCSSHMKGIKFATVKLWLAHVRNVHHKSYYCHRPDCKYRFNGPTPKAFGSQAVLDRHGLSKSHTRPVYCDKPGCTGKDNLARKDKRNKHQVEYHGQFLCSVPNCPRGQYLNGVYYGFGATADLLAHEHEKHASRGYDMTMAQSPFTTD
jgi:hypothetical protein